MKKIFLSFTFIWCVLLSNYNQSSLQAQSSSDVAVALLLVAASLVTPSLCTINYADDNGIDRSITRLGCGLDFEALGGNVVAGGVQFKLKSAKYAGFLDYGGQTTIKIDLGLGIPTDSDRFGGFYVGGSFGGGVVAVYRNQMLGYIWGLWTFLGNDNIGFKFSYDEHINGGEDPPLFYYQGKLYIGSLLTLSYDNLTTSIDGFNENLSFLSLGISYRGD